MRDHRWSGWPGAFCLDCGAEDQREICVGEHDVGISCIHGHVQCMDPTHPPQKCSEHVNTECPGRPMPTFDPDATIAHLRKLLTKYDQGQLTAAEVDSMLYTQQVVPVLEAVERGERYLTSSSCCCSAHPPDRSFTCRVTIHPHGHEITRID